MTIMRERRTAYAEAAGTLEQVERALGQAASELRMLINSVKDEMEGLPAGPSRRLQGVCGHIEEAIETLGYCRERAADLKVWVSGGQQSRAGKAKPR